MIGVAMIGWCSSALHCYVAPKEHLAALAAGLAEKRDEFARSGGELYR